MHKNYSIDEFRGLLAAGTPETSEAVIRAQFLEGIEAKADADETRLLTYTISTASVDRDRDVVSLDGWDFGNFIKNPVVLWAHNYRQLPVGRSSAPYRVGDKIKADVTFTPKGLSPFNDTVFEMYRLNFMAATSVGFLPKKWNWNEERKGGIDFIEQELLEFSLVPVPANPEALMDAKSAGIDIEPLKHWAQGILSSDPKYLAAEIVRELRKIRSPFFADPDPPAEKSIPDQWQLDNRRRLIEIAKLR